MPRTVGGVEIGILTLDAESRLPLYKQLYVRLRELILEGTLREEVRLPSNRTLAAELNVSRNTVVRAVEALVAEGYLSTRVGGGTYVASREPKEGVSPLVPLPRRLEFASQLEADSASDRVVGAALESEAVEGQPFELDLPALDAFPVEAWRRLWLRRSRQIETTDLGGGNVLGDSRLRQAIADHLALTRGLRCGADQVVIVASSLDAIDTIIRGLVSTGDSVWLEEPGDLRVRAAFLSSGARIQPVPVDTEGLDPEAVPSGTSARCIYTTPSHQFPVGVTLSVERRKALLELAVETGAWIIEDDRDAEFRFAGSPQPALQGLDRADRVIHVGSFAKAMYPSLRLGFMVVPKGLLRTVTATRELMDRQAPLFPQRVLADFIERGDFNGHLRRMRVLYQSRQALLSASVEAASGGALRARADNMGTHLVVDLPDGAAEVGVMAASHRHRLGAQALSSHYVGLKREYGVLLGYGHLLEREVPGSVTALLSGLARITVSGASHRLPLASGGRSRIRPAGTFASKVG